jgi:hypothetical protein
MSEGSKASVSSESKLNREEIERVVMEVNFRNRSAQQNEVARELEVIQSTIRNLEKGFARELKEIDQKRLVMMINTVDEYCKREFTILHTRLQAFEQALAEAKKRISLLLTQEKKESEDYSLIGVKKLYPV